MAVMADRFYGSPSADMNVIGVTGTNGKTTTTYLVERILADAGKPCGVIGTIEARYGGKTLPMSGTTPDALELQKLLADMAEAGMSACAMEVSSHALEQGRVKGVRFRTAIFTNLTQDHLDYHQTMDSYRAAKMRLWQLVTRFAVINADSPEAAAFEAGARAIGGATGTFPLDAVMASLSVVTAGWRAGAEGLKIVEIQPRPNGQTLTLRWRNAETDVDLPLIGEFQALNAVMAAALALALGEGPKIVFAGMEKLEPVKGRIEHVGATKAGAHVFVDYAHTPDGLDVLLRAARPHAPGRVIVVFGCGGDRDAGKRAKMGAIAKRQARSEERRVGKECRL